MWKTKAQHESTSEFLARYPPSKTTIDQVHWISVNNESSAPRPATTQARLADAIDAGTEIMTKLEADPVAKGAKKGVLRQQAHEILVRVAAEYQ